MLILLMTKNSELINSAEQALNRDYNVMSLISGTDLKETLRHSRPSLIILDLTTPEGIDTLKELEIMAEINESPIIVLVNQNNPKVIQKALALGAADIILSPFLPELLLSRVSNQLELSDYRSRAHDFEKLQDVISVSIAELVECRDTTTGGHLKNSTLYFKILLEEITGRNEYLGVIPHEDIRNLLRSAPLHDIGKIGINDEVLRKASALNNGEFEYMKTHTILGKETFDKIMKETGESRFLILARNLAYCHHERWDGTGYPNGLMGEEIPLYVRIFAIADVYDALTSYRAYKEAFSHQKAVDIINEGKGSSFDPALVEIFLEIQDRFEEALLLKK